MSNQQLALQFFLQFAVILIACRLVGSLMLRVGQPRVIGEMIAGILLGPSLLGLFAPSVQTMLFPPESLRLLSAVSQFGLAQCWPHSCTLTAVSSRPTCRDGKA
ncbi:MAG: hypothetical protein ABIS29_16760 [Vicinamibacterales bacterium]